MSRPAAGNSKRSRAVSEVEARSPIPRGDMTPDQRRRIGALQVAKALLVGTGYNANTPSLSVRELLRLAKYVEKGE